MNKRMGLCLFAAMALFVCGSDLSAESDFDIGPRLEKYNVRWDVPGPTSRESMPVGNGDIGLNVWVEPNGDLGLLISKADAWADTPQSEYGLIKVGGMHVSLHPSPFPLVGGTPFLQVLKLREGEIQIRQGDGDREVTLRVWVDANHPVVRIEVQSRQPVSTKVTLDNWRLESANEASPDVLLPNQVNRIAWYHRNGPKAEPHVVDLTTGAIIKGEGLVNGEVGVLQSTAPRTSQLISVYPLTEKAGTAEQWLSDLEKQLAQIDALNLEQTRGAHQKWWNDFWHRSWIFIEGDRVADEITRGYILQRFITACAGRGAYPIKFNGSLFIVDSPNVKRYPDSAPGVNADYRAWGGQYWFQNTRAMYWPRLMAGDFDIMMPLFKMYAGMIPANAEQVRKFYGHEGAYIAETSPFWGGLKFMGPNMPEGFTDHYFVPILELSMMMLDYYDYTGDRKFAQEMLMPVATAGLQFYDQHFYRDEQGKILIDPVNAIEMYWKVRNPTPDVAALQAVLPRMIALPEDLVDSATRARWKKMLQEVPPIPVGMKNGKQVVLPYAGEQTAKRHNAENPELYAIYPYRIYGLGKPNLQLAIDTFNARLCNHEGCWVQDPIQAAMLGLTDVARKYVHANMTRKEPELKFPAFWAKGGDYQPDQDNGGNGEHGLQLMLMQTEGRKILLLPAWPQNWNVEFKLNAPLQTTVQGKFDQGKITHLIVNPPERKADVTDMSQVGK